MTHSKLTFNTAWSPPEGVVAKLREKFPDLHFNVSMMNQMRNCGVLLNGIL